MNEALIHKIVQLGTDDPQAFHHALTESNQERRRRMLDRWFDAASAAWVSAWADQLVTAKSKWPHLDRPLFTRRALEQGTRHDVAHWRAQRIERRLPEQGDDQPWVDFTCGAGGEWTTWLTDGVLEKPRPTMAFEPDPVLAACAQENASRLLQPATAGPSPPRVQHESLESALDAGAVRPGMALVDPDRRSDEDRRHARSLTETRPDAGTMRSLADRVSQRLVIKAAPALEDVGPLGELGAEWTWVAAQDEVREVSLWFGPLRRAARSCIALPSQDELTRVDSQPALPALRLPQAGNTIAIPSRVVRASRLVPELASSIRAEATTGSKGVLISPDSAAPMRPGPGSLYRTFVVDDVLPTSRAQLRRTLRSWPTEGIEWKRLPSPPLGREIEDLLRRKAGAPSSAARSVLLQLEWDGKAILLSLAPI